MIAIKFWVGMTAVLSWHVQNFVMIIMHTTTNFPSNLNYDGTIVREMGPGPISSQFFAYYDSFLIFHVFW